MLTKNQQGPSYRRVSLKLYFAGVFLGPQNDATLQGGNRILRGYLTTGTLAHLSHEKKKLLLSIESCLFKNRDPKIMAYDYNPHITGVLLV